MRSLILLFTVLLAGCLTSPPVPVQDSGAPTRIEANRAAKAAGDGSLYTVKKGDTLYSIALDHGVDYREIIAWNNIDNPNRIRLGQQLRVTAPGATKPAVAEGTAEVRPVTNSGGPVARSLDEKPQQAASQGAVATQEAVGRAPTSVDDGDKVKRAPKGGKLPYSEENLAKLKAQEAPAAVAPPPANDKPVAEKPAAPAAPAAVPAAANVEWGWPTNGKLLAAFSESGGETNKGLDLAGKIGEPVVAASAGKVIYVGQMNKYGNLAIVLHGGGYSSVYAHNSKILVKEGQMVARGQKIAELGDSDADQPKLHFEIRQQGKPVDPTKLLPPR